MLSEDNALLWLSTVKHMTKRRVDALTERFGSGAELARLGEAKLVKYGVNRELAHSMFEHSPEMMAAKVLSDMYKSEMDFISLSNPKYPPLLRQTVDCPIGIFVRGTLPDYSAKFLAVVGSRRCTQYGATAAYSLSKELAAKGVVIVSGMADGTDSMAHKGALEGDGFTVAVLGCGADVCYPAGNRGLMEKILAKGCIISELPPGTRPSKYTFPARNRIISGLSNVVAVIEADERSGTLITVNHALEQGRDVMALPGNINSRLSRGTNRLIKEGAAIITCVEDIIELLGIEEKKENKKNSEKTDISLASEEKLVYDCIHSEPVTVDEIVLKTGLSLREVQYALTMLELKQLVLKLTGQKYISA